MILILDGHNLLHRARSGFQLGDYHVVYNFARQLRALVEQFKPTRCYFTLEGEPKRQLRLLGEYKANRAMTQADADDPKKVASFLSFQRQKALAVEMLVKHFPLSVVQHPDFEADDVVYNLAKNSSRSADFTIVSTDTDFIQVLQELPNVRLYNPVTKKLVEAPPTRGPGSYDYVVWKALRGDGSDNIPALVTEGEAMRLALDFDALNASELSNSPEFHRNLELIDFHAWTAEEALGMRSSVPTRDWERVRELFEGWGFQSMLKEPTWAKFVATFDALWEPVV